MTGQGGATVLVVDDDPSVRRGLSRLLQAHGFAVESYGSAEELLAATLPGGLFCLVLDVRLPGLDGFALQRALAATRPAPPMVFISGHGDIPTSVRAVKAGAIDFLPKPVGEKTLMPAVREALAEARRRHAEDAAGAAARAQLSKLTRREAAVLELVVAGLTNKEIAARLGIAVATVKLHRGCATRKLGVHSVPGLVRLFAAGGRMTARE